MGNGGEKKSCRRGTYRIDGLLQLDGFSSSLALIGSEHPRRVAVLNAAPKGLGGESCEHNGVDGSDTGTGKHGHGELRNHGHVQSDHIA